MRHALISIHPEYVAEILDGMKTVEVRTRNVHLSPGSYLWIYSTLPVGQIQAVAKVNDMYRLSPSRAWSKFGPQMRLTKSQFMSYVNGSNSVSAIELANVSKLRNVLPLESLRRWDRNFQPPQFIKYLEAAQSIWPLLARAKPDLFKLK